MSFSKLEKIISEVSSFIAEKLSLYRKDYPDWLNSLRGESPLLGREEWEFIADVRCQIIREAKSRPSFPYDQHLKNKLSIMKDNFEHVVKYLKESSESKEYFVQIYPEWQKFRNLTILQLKDIAKSININSRNSAASRGIGSTVSLIGGLMALATGAGALRIVGSFLMGLGEGLGSLTSAGTSAVELELLRIKLKEAEKVLQEDKEYSEKMWNWISDVGYIQDALNTIRDIDVDKYLKNCARDLLACFKNKGSMKEAKMIIEKSTKCLKVSPEIGNEIADVIGILLTISMLYDRYRLLFNRAFEAFKCEKVLTAAYGIIVDTVKMKSAINVGKSSKLSNFQKSGIGIGIALDAINIILVSNSINSTCKEAKEIVKAAGKLQEEARVFKNLYDAVKYL